MMRHALTWYVTAIVVTLAGRHWRDRHNAPAAPRSGALRACRYGVPLGVALLFAAQVAIGITMTSLALTDPRVFALYQAHKSIGATIFVLVVLRLVWRLSGRGPDLLDMPRWQRIAARTTHAALYAALLVMPLLGWVVVSASPYGIPTVLYGFVELPHLAFIVVSPHKQMLGSVASWAHWILAWAVSVAVIGHIAAALRHHFIVKDDVLKRMLPPRL